MKNVKILIFLMTLAVVGVSCETHDDYDSPRKPVVGFTALAQNINNISQGDSKEISVEVFASDVSSSDRTFNLTTVPIEDTETNPPADPENYSFDSSVTIPAGERVGNFTVTGTNVSLTTDRTFFKITIENDPSVVAGGEILIGLKGR